MSKPEKNHNWCIRCKHRCHCDPDGCQVIEFGKFKYNDWPCGCGLCMHLPDKTSVSCSVCKFETTYGEAWRHNCLAKSS